MPARTRIPTGPIPARAGEPHRLRQVRRQAWAYPRACGGTSVTLPASPNTRGLSPRVRGNPILKHQAAAKAGPIPARAGEPRHAPPRGPRRRAYPRACGGTADDSRFASPDKGLSPRVRGNRRHTAPALRRLRPIPARAGEPNHDIMSPASSRAYPRACGGTRQGRQTTGAGRGLSPRVRGNRRQVGGMHIRLGPIPARAGEPTRARIAVASIRAYPRACGGTAGERER